MKKTVASILIIALCFGFGSFVAKYYKPFAKAAPQSATPIFDGNIFNDEVDSIVVDGDIAYIGGAFTSFGKESRYGGSVDSTTGLIVHGELALNSTIQASAPDGSGGWYIGGDFTSVGGQARNYLAHILSTGTVDPTWNPNPSLTGDDVYIGSIEVSGSDIYVAGLFDTIGGQSRNKLAKLNDSTGAADATWNPAPDASVGTIAVSGSTIYVGGTFTTIGGQSRAGLAKLNNTTGAADVTWNPPARDGAITHLAVSGSDIYVAGTFYNIGVDARTGVAKLNNTTGAVDPAWNPDPTLTDDDAAIYAMAISGSSIYVGGLFDAIGGQSRNNLAKLNNTTGAADASWNPSPDDEVDLIAVNGSDIYVFGYYSSIGGQTRSTLTKLNNTTGAADASWNPSSDGATVNTVSMSGASVFIGGDFTTVGGVSRNRLAAIDLTTNELTDWNPNASDNVNVLAISGSDIYVGGTFTTIGGESRNRLAKVDADTGTVDGTFNPNVSGFSPSVTSIAVSGTDVYVGGRFDTIGGLSRNNVAKLNNTNGNADAAFNMNAYFNGFGSIPSIEIVGSSLYIAGSFSITAGLSHFNRVVKVAKATGVVDESWLGNCSSCGGADAYYMKIISPYIYVSGNFSTFDGISSGKLVRLNLDGSVDHTWNPNSNSTVYAITDSGSDLYVGGSFTNIGGESVNKLAKLNTTDGLADSDWKPVLSDTVRALAFYDNSLLASGYFTQNFARFDFPTIAFSSTQSTGGEATSNPGISVALNTVSDIDTTVSYSITGGTTTSGSDFTSGAGTVTIPAGSTTANLPITITDDSEIEGGETIEVTLSSPLESFLGDNTIHTFTITDNDHAGVVALPSFNQQNPPNSNLPLVVIPPNQLPQTPEQTQSGNSQTPTIPAPFKFLRSLWYGKTGTDVSLLQQFLNERNFILANSGAGSPGKETNYFGPRTQRALKKFQAAYKDSLHKVSGYLDTSTRNLINSLF